MKTAVILSGNFNPIQKRHLEYFNNAMAFANELIVVNNEPQRSLKGSREFQDEQERMTTVSNIKSVDHVVLAIDKECIVC